MDCNGHTVSGSRSGFATGITLPQGVSGVTIKNCEVIGFGGDGFRVIGARSNTLQDNTARHNSGSGFYIGGGGDLKLQDNTARHNSGSGFALEAAFDNTLQDNTARHNGEGGFAIFAGSINNNLEGNTARHNSDTGFFLSDTSINNSLSENEADNNRGFGYADNTFLNVIGTGTAGTQNIYIDNECHGNRAGGSNPTGLCEPQV